SRPQRETSRSDRENRGRPLSRRPSQPAGCVEGSARENEAAARGCPSSRGHGHAAGACHEVAEPSAGIAGNHDGAPRRNSTALYVRRTLTESSRRKSGNRQPAGYGEAAKFADRDGAKRSLSGFQRAIHVAANGPELSFLLHADV